MKPMVFARHANHIIISLSLGLGLAHALAAVGGWHARNPRSRQLVRIIEGFFRRLQTPRTDLLLSLAPDVERVTLRFSDLSLLGLALGSTNIHSLRLVVVRHVRRVIVRIVVRIVVDLSDLFLDHLLRGLSDLVDDTLLRHSRWDIEGNLSSRSGRDHCCLLL